MPTELTLVDRIVDGVLRQLSQPAESKSSTIPSSSSLSKSSINPSKPTVPEVSGIVFEQQILTAEILLDRVQSGQQIWIGPKAILTPSAQDLVRARRIQVQRRASSEASSSPQKVGTAIICRASTALDRLLAESPSGWSRQLSGTTAEGVQMAIQGLARGEFPQVILSVADPVLAACLANRHSTVFAAAVPSASDLKSIQAQMRVNCWCIDPANKSFFELKNLLRSCGRA